MLACVAHLAEQRKLLLANGKVTKYTQMNNYFLKITDVPEPEGINPPL
jgi:hypothetical protein